MILQERLAKETAREYASRIIRDNITMLELEPGSRVSENELAAELKISRTPVREALIELSRGNVVEIYPQKGSYISKINYGFVEEAEFTRLALEKAIVQELCRMKDVDYRELDKVLKLTQFYIENDDVSMVMELDKKFHKKLFILANKEHTHQLLDNVMVHYDRVRRLTVQSINCQYVVDDHSAILEALKKCDGKNAVKHMEKHLARYKMDKDALMKIYPDYFE